jgi:hypothetical protein
MGTDRDVQFKCQVGSTEQAQPVVTGQGVANPEQSQGCIPPSTGHWSESLLQRGKLVGGMDKGGIWDYGDIFIAIM